MKRDELLKLWCKAEGGKVQALDWPQSKQAYAILRRIIAEELGIDLDDVIAGKSLTIDAAGVTNKAEMYEAFPVYAWAIDGNKARRSSL